jgi:hypothetical protein
MSPEELASEYGISVSRLADLRSQGKGPPYFKFGGIWYPREDFDSWVLQQMKGEEYVDKKEKRQMALQIPVQGPRVHGQHRFGRHTTKQEGRGRDCSRGPERPEEGETSDN